MGVAYGFAGPKIIKDGLILYLDAGNPNSYNLTKQNMWKDLIRNNNGNLINNPIFISSKDASSIKCGTDVTNAYIEILDNNILDFGTNNFTVEYWFKKLQATSGFSNIWGPTKWNTGGNPGTNEWYLGIGNGTNGSGDTYAFGVEVGSTLYSTGESSETLSLNTWYQLVGIRNGNKLQTYLNAILKQDVSPAGFTAASSINNIGRNLRIANSNLNSYYTNCEISSLKIYNRALTSTEILQNYNATKGRFSL
jgi:hypothetical protein